MMAPPKKHRTSSTTSSQQQQHWFIASIEARAFKSFGSGSGSSTRFDFVPSSGLVGITGANGCGKSNLLEAVCFACAAGPSALRLTTSRGLRDVTSTEAGQQLPEVRLTLQRGGSHEQHVLEARLTPDGTRAYKVDGRARTGVAVKELLKTCGIVVDGTTVIQQATVTQLSDTNNASALADLVAGASGLTSWQQGAAAARQEVARTRRALTDIQANIACLTAGSAADDAAMRAAAQAAQLDAELEQQLTQLLAGLQAAQARRAQEADAARDAEQELQAAEAAAAAQLRQLQSDRQQLAAQHGQVEAALEQGSAEGQELLQRVAAAESRLAALRQAASSRAAVEAELQAAQDQLQQQEAQIEQLQRALRLRQQAAAQLAARHAADSSSSDVAGAAHAAAHTKQLQEVQRRVAAAAAEVVRQQAEVDARELDARHLRSQLAGVSAAAAAAAAASGQRRQDAVSQAVPAAKVEVAAALAAARAQQQHLTALQQQLVRLRMDADTARRQLTAPGMARLLASLPADCPAQPLHACFSFRPEHQQDASRLLTALSAIAGPSVLQTLVVPSTAHADTLLAAAAAEVAPAGAAGRRLKIWPLDRLAAGDARRQQRAAQQQLGAAAVTLPLDVLAACEPAYEASLLRAFGSAVIVADDATAAAVVERFPGLTAVTLQGTVSRRGTMSGGWASSAGSESKGAWAAKLALDSAAAAMASVQQRVADAAQEEQQLAARRAAADQQLAAAEQAVELQASAAAADAVLQRERQQLAELQACQATWQQQLEECQAAAGDAAGDASAGAGGDSAAAAAALQARLQAAGDAAAAAEQQLEAAQELGEALAARVEAAECRLAAMQVLPSGDQAADNTQDKPADDVAAAQVLRELQQQQVAAAATAAQQRQRLQQLEQQQRELDTQLAAAELQLSPLQARAREAAAAVTAAAAAREAAASELTRVQREFAEADAVQRFVADDTQPTSSAPAAPAPAAAGQAEKARLQALSKAVRQLRARLSKLQAPQLLPGQKEACTARLAQIARFKEQAAALTAAAGALEALLGSGADEVHAANDAVFHDVAAGFSQLCASLLPSLKLQLVRTASLAHEGLQFRFRRLQEAGAAAAVGAADDAAGSWQLSLGQLSGGQRTLVSLAMLLAVARTGSGSGGGRGHGLLLLDEVDAALDEANTARAAALLRALAHGGDDGTPGCQVLAVTHNAAFQGLCDATLRVVKPPGGSTQPADQQQPEQHQAAAAGGKRGVGGSGGLATRSKAKTGSRQQPAAAATAGAAAKRVRFAVRQ